MAKKPKKPAAAADSEKRAVSVRISRRNFERAEELARKNDISVSAILQMALAEKLEREEKKPS